MKYIVFCDDSWDPQPTTVCDDLQAVQNAVDDLIDNYDQQIDDIKIYELGRKGQASRSINVSFGDAI